MSYPLFILLFVTINPYSQHMQNMTLIDFKDGTFTLVKDLNPEEVQKIKNNISKECNK